MKIEEKIILLADLIPDRFEMVYCRRSKIWEIRNTTDEGIGSENPVFFRHANFKDVVEIAYDILNNGMSDHLLEKKKELEKEFGCTINIRGNVFFVDVPEGYDHQRIADHKEIEYIEMNFIS